MANKPLSCGKVTRGTDRKRILQLKKLGVSNYNIAMRLRTSQANVSKVLRNAKNNASGLEPELGRFSPPDASIVGGDF